MSTQTTDKPTIDDIDSDDDRTIMHWYRVGSREPRPGDVADCGHVKRTPPDNHLRYPPHRRVDCLVCEDLVGRRFS